MRPSKSRLLPRLLHLLAACALASTGPVACGSDETGTEDSPTGTIGAGDPDAGGASLADLGPAPDDDTGDTPSPDAGGEVGQPDVLPDAPPDVGEDTGSPDQGRPSGATDFVSADGVNGATTPSDESDPELGAPTDADSAGGEERTVEEGDIYRVLGGDLILNLNAYRGLQVIDFSDPSAPEIIGRVQVSGSPVELYVVGDRAYVLLNNWWGYYGARDDVWVDSYDGGLVLAVDLDEPTAPTVVDRAKVPGWIRTSRLTRGGGQAALYVVANEWGVWPDEEGVERYQTRTVVKSFDVSDGGVEPVSELNLGGYVADIQATVEALLVARNDWTTGEHRTLVSLIDITDPGGAMVEGDEVRARGWVRNKTNMDLRGGVLRIVSGSTWSGTQTNHLETFDASEFGDLSALDHCEFGAGESLFATLFLDDRAFFVTYLRVDPFHAFALGADGSCQEASEFEVSGWNDFFRPVFDDTRLLGIGVNDEGGATMAVSLYDVTDLGNASPLLARAEVEADRSWSEARWDDRAFSVLEDAVSIAVSGDVTETGLVLLPFSGWNDDEDGYVAAVQIFTFSETTLTRRGLMVHGTPVRRSFLAEADMTANLSEVELSFFECTDPDLPVELGRVELAPNYTDFLVYGDHGARLENRSDYWGYGWIDPSGLPPSTVEIVSLAEDPDLADGLASFNVPAGATVYRVGSLLISVDMRAVDTSEWPYIYETTIDIFDLDAPTDPELVGTVVTRDLRPVYDYYGWAELDCLGDCMPYYGAARQTVFPSDDALVFLQPTQEQELLGVEEVCTTYPADPETCDADTDPDCAFYSGSITCRSLDGAPPLCQGEILRCVVGDDGGWDCESIDPDRIATTESCYEWERYRYWQRYALYPLDLSRPDSPALTDPIELPREDEGVSAVADGDHLWVSVKRPVDVEDDPRPYVRYFAYDLDLSDPSDPEPSPPINLPGELLAIDGDTVYTRDTIWGERIVEAAVDRLVIRDDLAYLQATAFFPDQEVHTVRLDGAGHVLVSHRLAWQIAYDRGIYDAPEVLTILDGLELSRLGEVSVDRWATLRDARAGRALYEVPGGLLLLNVADPTAPFAQAYFPVRGWPRRILMVDDRVYFPAGRYGVYAFDLDTYNLLTDAM